MNGVSIVICCHNSSIRLSQTLAHLAAQQVSGSFPWEVILVDNASTDDTAEIAKSILIKNQIVSYRIVHESQLGLSHARHRGLKCANYEFVSFVDDDNWVMSDWVQTVYTVMTEHPNVGACGGMSEAVFEAEPPVWFAACKGNYAVGSQSNECGDISDTRGWLWGAGLNIRKSACMQLVDQGFRSILSGRNGTALTSGEDMEICLALRMAGWRLWYDPRLRLQHYMPAQRLQWHYLRRLHQGFGAATVDLEPYWFALGSSHPKRRKGRLGAIWMTRAHITLRKLLEFRAKLLRDLLQKNEGDIQVLEMELLLARLRQFLKRRGEYDKNIYTIWNAPWRMTNKSTNALDTANEIRK